MAKSVFLSNIFEQRKTIDTLLEESRVDADYYLFLFFGTFITVLGLIFGNAVIIMAGMIITPILFPVLSLGMGLATVSKKAITRATLILFKSSILVFAISIVITFLTNENNITEQMLIASRPDIWLFLIAFFSGIVAAYSWMRKGTSIALPSIALSVSLIVPLSAVGISVSIAPFSREIFSGALMLFVINLLGVVLASTIVFLLFGFSNLQQWQDNKIKEEKEEEKKDKSKKNLLDHDDVGDVVSSNIT
ncbi:MAG: hypothetical protein COV70_01660 [Parcubacteria group bacterium CG11_big_fil_rev_8_21_14_0_20_39_22]|nr:MAG: hypothetical protein COV70_01660 [Parcubacteria group bacterium CG11_big_fil_rev_8_21_14_0_20_39_22]